MTHPHQKGADVPIITTTKPLGDIIAETRSRVAELEPLVDEHARLTAFLDAVDHERGRTFEKLGDQVATRARTAATTDAAPRRGRPRGGKRAEQVLAWLRTEGPLTIPALADRIGIKQNYLYRVLPDLERDGKVRRNGRSWVVV